jgi:hypothetical protein
MASPKQDKLSSHKNQPLHFKARPHSKFGAKYCTILQTDVRPLLQQKIKVKIEFVFTKKEGSWQRREGKT